MSPFLTIATTTPESRVLPCRSDDGGDDIDISDSSSDASSESGSDSDPSALPEDVQEFFDECYPAYYANLYHLQDEEEWCPDVCHHMLDPAKACKGSCSIKYNGYTPRTRCYDVDGPHTLHIRVYKCTAHNSIFNVFEPCLAATIDHVAVQQRLDTAPAADNRWPHGQMFAVKRMETFMTSSFIRKLASNFETGQSIRSIQQAVRNEWAGNWRDRASLYNADHGTSINPDSFSQHCRFLGSRRTVVETLADIFNSYLARPLTADMAALHQHFCRQASMFISGCLLC